MLTIWGGGHRFCDGVSRRSFLQIGGLALGGLSLPQLLRAEAAAGSNGSRKSVIMVYLPGGPSHLEMFDPKPDAPVEIRGEFGSIETGVAGIRIGEHLPRLAAIMDKLIPIRSIVGGVEDHSSHMCQTGRSGLGPQPAGGWPTLGAVVSKTLGPREPSVPPYVNVTPKIRHKDYNDRGPGMLGLAHAPFTPDGESRANLTLRGISLDRLHDREALRNTFDGLRRDLDSSGVLAGLDAFSAQAIGMITASKLRDALDISREEPRVRERYGKGNPTVWIQAAPCLTDQFLLARRLVEAGVRCVSLAFGSWDWHSKNFVGLKGQLPHLDQGLSALIEDLHERGLDQEVAVVAWGEFGRSPRVNAAAGRDHWPAVSGAVLAGGGFRAGQVIGSTNRQGEAPRDRPVHFQEVFATLYHHLGIDARRTLITDFSGRPHYVIEDYEPIREVNHQAGSAVGGFLVPSGR